MAQRCELAPIACAHGEVAHRPLASIEVAMPHEIVRRVSRADLKLVALALFAVLPQHDVPFTSISNLISNSR